MDEADLGAVVRVIEDRGGTVTDRYTHEAGATVSFHPPGALDGGADGGGSAGGE